MGDSAALTARPWTPREEAIYDIGHRDGESCNGADWSFMLTEHTDMPDSVDAWSPTDVAAYVQSLIDRIKELEAGNG